MEEPESHLKAAIGDVLATQERLANQSDALEELRESNAALQREKTAVEGRLHEIETSLSWLLILKARNLRARILRPGTLPGRCYAFIGSFINTARIAGLSVALRSTRARLARKLGRYRIGGTVLGRTYFRRVFSRNVRVDRFRELPWRFLPEVGASPPRSAGHFKILLISHSAGRTGAPLCLLRLAEELTRLPDFECFIVLLQGGELEDSFARIAPTLHVDWLVAQGVNRRDVPAAIASAFHDFSSRGVAVCNTLVVSEFHEAFREHQVEVLSWLHELPTFISQLGGDRAIDAIKGASRKIMVPSEAVRAALVARYGIIADSIRTVYNGQDPYTQGLEREPARTQVRRELGLPDDARIVLGCGTVDLRKGADLFVSVARRVILGAGSSDQSPSTFFVWIGHSGEDNVRRWILHDSRLDGLGNRIRFIGPRSSVASYYLASDLLALTSREDPCPLVNMEAMESGLPVVAFHDAGGAPEVLGDAGVCVPYLDTSAMAQAVRDLLADPERRHAMGRRGQSRDSQPIHLESVLGAFLDILQTEFNYRQPHRLKVSVVIPNYRHARYLEERIQSVFDQTYLPHEIIVLDDASPDESVSIAKKMARRSPVPMQVVVNDVNSGSTFRQWLKGMSLATGDLIWFAESDDCAHPLYLERLVPEFSDPKVKLAYCQSALIGTKGERLADDFLAHTDDISRSHWRGRYTATALVEAEIALSQKNTIPNASAVLFRKPQNVDFADELVTLKFAGDWLFYSMLIRDGKVGFIPEVLNFYRRHEATVSHRSVREDDQASESLYVKARIFETYPVSAEAITASLARSALEYDQLTEKMGLTRPAFALNPRLTGSLARIKRSFESRVNDQAAKVMKAG